MVMAARRTFEAFVPLPPEGHGPEAIQFKLEYETVTLWHCLCPHQEHGLDESGLDLGRRHRWSRPVYRSGPGCGLADPQFTRPDGDEGLRADGGCAGPLTAAKQRLDQLGGKLFRTDAVTVGNRVSCWAVLPGKPDSNGLQVFRNPGAVEASQHQHFIVIGSDGADFIFFTGEHDCFEDGSV